VESLQAALRESQEAGERVELTLTERMRQLTAAAAGAQVSYITSPVISELLSQKKIFN
jgi:hypothetical protein